MTKEEIEELRKKHKKEVKTELYCDNFQNYKRYAIPKAQLVIADIPYNLGANAFGSNPMWYKGGDRKNGESKKAGKSFFNTDYNFNIAEYFHFCNKLLKKEPKERGQAPCMIVFCSFEQMPTVIEYAKKHGFKKNIPMHFIKNYSAQALKANMRPCGAVEHALILYRDKLPKFRNKDKEGVNRMVFNWLEWKRDSAKEIPKVHPTQKPSNIIRRLIELFTDPGDVVIDPVAGSAITLRMARELGRSSYGFEVFKDFYTKAKTEMLGQEGE